MEGQERTASHPVSFESQIRPRREAGMSGTAPYSARVPPGRRGEAPPGASCSRPSHQRLSVLGQRAVAGPISQSEHPLAYGEAGGPVPQLNDDARQLAAGTLGVRSCPARSTHVVGQSSPPRVNRPACTRTMTSFWAAWGYGVSVKESPATLASRSRTVMACMMGCRALSRHCLFATVYVEGRARDGSVGHDVDGEGGDVSRADDSADR